MVTTIIAFCLSAALVIYLFKWYGVIGIMLFTLCAITAKKKRTDIAVKISKVHCANNIYEVRAKGSAHTVFRF